MEGQSIPKHVFPFSKLAPEIRNAIYRLSLVANGALEIEDLRPDMYSRLLAHGCGKRRTSYSVADYCWPGFVNHCEGAPQTTYDSTDIAYQHKPVVALLALNWQIRNEALSVFYGSNTFYFTTINSLVPFMLDRTPAALRSLESLKIHLRLGGVGQSPDNPAEPINCDAWENVLSELRSFRVLKVRRLIIHVDDLTDDIMPGEPDLGSSSLRWIPAPCQTFNGLDMLGIDYISPVFLKKGIASIAIMRKFGESLWDIMAPSMLAKLRDPHDGGSLMHRRIHDIYDRGSAHRLRDIFHLVHRMNDVKDDSDSNDGDEDEEASDEESDEDGPEDDEDSRENEDEDSSEDDDEVAEVEDEDDVEEEETH